MDFAHETVEEQFTDIYHLLNFVIRSIFETKR